VIAAPVSPRVRSLPLRAARAAGLEWNPLVGTHRRPPWTPGLQASTRGLSVESGDPFEERDAIGDSWAKGPPHSRTRTPRRVGRAPLRRAGRRLQGCGLGMLTCLVNPAHRTNASCPTPRDQASSFGRSCASCRLWVSRSVTGFPRHCPRCGSSELREIVYGAPSDERLLAAWSRGECMLRPRRPTDGKSAGWMCAECGLERSEMPVHRV
jgi:hypothetical protein